MNERRAFRGLPLAGMAGAGVVLGHWLAYRVAVPQVQIRNEILARTGHAYWLVAIQAAVIFGLAGLGTLALRHFGRPLDDDGSNVHTYSWLARRLVLLQAVAFTAMEITERLVAGAPVAGMFGHHLFVLGLAVQVLLAYTGAFVLLGFSRGARLVAAAVRRRRIRPSARPRLLPRGAIVRPLPLLAGATGVRGPPRS